MRPSKSSVVAEVAPEPIAEVVISPETRKAVVGALRMIDEIKHRVFDAPPDATLVITLASKQ